MREFSFEEGLKKTLAKLYKKDRLTYEILLRKIEEILSAKDLNHCKNLRNPLQASKRIHVRGPFILIFKHQASDDSVQFFDFDHHDYIYAKR
jgi:mRNA-degrading endonuclease RelE of RelBE toxin-antitoxin system